MSQSERTHLLHIQRCRPTSTSQEDNLLRCQWCGATGTADEFELDEEHGDGFWCPDCDGHTYFDPERNKYRRVLLLLESDGREEAPSNPRQRQTISKQLSPLRYPGGKSKLIDFLLEKFREQQMDTFVEPFAGGASVGLAMLDAGLTKKLILNDLDFGVYAFWKCVCESPQLLLERLKGPAPTRKDFFDARAVLLEGNPPIISELAWAQLVCNRLSFSGITMANPLGEKTGLLARWNPETLAKRIMHVHSMADRIQVLHVDANKVIEKEYWGDKTTLFIDPPYVHKGAALYPKAFTEDDHRKLAFNIECLYTGMPGGDIIITYDDCPLIRELYPFATIQTIGRRYSCRDSRHK